MNDSQQLLAAYAVDHSESAFRELVTRYVNFVYSTALRLVDGNSQLAEDVTQTVFITLANKASSLSKDVMLGGWLHQHTFHLATKALRNERRRQARELKAIEMNPPPDPSEEPWHQIVPVLDEAVRQLAPEDRTAILLRFFERRDFRAVGQALGSSEDAARMRVQRALHKLHALLGARGVALPVLALGALLSTKAVTAAPAGLAVAAATVALSGTAAHVGGGITFLKIMTNTQVKWAVTALLGLGTAATLLVQHNTRLAQSRQLQSLRQQFAQLAAENDALSNAVRRSTGLRAPRFPTPAVRRAAAPAEPVEAGVSGNLFSLLTNKPAHLTVQQVAPYLEANRRNAASLLAAFRTTGNPELLDEAMQKYPDHPQVAFEAALRKDAPPAERRRWLDALKQSAPDNALANYLSATDYFKAGQTDQAVQELLGASSKHEFKDYALDRVQDDEEAYRAAGYSVAESKVVASMQLLLPQLVQIKDLSGSILDLANSYSQAGDQASRQTMLQIAVNLGRRYSDPAPGETLISQLVGVAVERKALAAMDPATPYDDSGTTVQQRLDQLAEHRTSIKELNEKAEPLWPSVAEQDWISYNSRSVAFGEEAALRWLVGKYAQP
jgi:RNA polymerase sigma factor (sigma-70 family)